MGKFSSSTHNNLCTHKIWSRLQIQATAIYSVGHKNDPTCFCRNFVKSPPNLIIFGREIAKTIKLCKIYSLCLLYTSDAADE